MLDQNLLTEWYALTQELPAKIAREKQLRQLIFNDAFKAPALGTNRLGVGHGKDLIAVYSMSYGVDKTALAAADTSSIPAELFHGIIKHKPEVAEGAWKAATDAQRALFAAFVTVKPALPSMKIDNVKQRG